MDYTSRFDKCVRNIIVKLMDIQVQKFKGYPRGIFWPVVLHSKNFDNYSIYYKKLYGFVSGEGSKDIDTAASHHSKSALLEIFDNYEK